MKRFFVCLVLLACKGAPPETTTAPPVAKADTFGSPITEPNTALSQLLADPVQFKGKTIATSGTVKSVCQHQGCWLTLADGEKDAMVRMHGHSFFVPPGWSKGRKARVQGTIVLMTDGKECEDITAQNAQLELDATGVELEQM